MLSLNYLSNWNIPCFFRSGRVSFSVTDAALVTVLDSGEPTRSMDHHRAWSKLRSELTIYDFGVSMRAQRLSELVSAEPGRYLTGFDELWFFYQAVDIKRPPWLGEVTAEIELDQRFDIEVRGAVERWMLDNGCFLALGDGTGCGLNVAYLDPALRYDFD